MSNHGKTEKRIKALAYLHRYLPLSVVVLILIPMSPSVLFCLLGAMFFVLGVWTFVGYKLRWKHIFCSFQDTYRNSMTPESIRWGWLEKRDVYGVSIIEGVMGIASIVFGIAFF